MADEHEKILLGFEGVEERLHDANALLAATRENYLLLAQQHAVLRERIRRIAQRWNHTAVSRQIEEVLDE